MGRSKSITPLVCAHSHFTYEERLQLEFPDRIRILRFFNIIPKEVA